MHDGVEENLEVLGTLTHFNLSGRLDQAHNKEGRKMKFIKCLRTGTLLV